MRAVTGALPIRQAGTIAMLSTALMPRVAAHVSYRRDFYMPRRIADAAAPEYRTR